VGFRRRGVPDFNGVRPLASGFGEAIEQLALHVLRNKWHERRGQFCERGAIELHLQTKHERVRRSSLHEESLRLAMMPLVPPAHNAASFSCPSCRAYAHQIWSLLIWNPPGLGNQVVTDCQVAQCEHCHAFSFWVRGTLVHPMVAMVTPANPDLPRDIQDDYIEAGEIVGRSPRGAAALLRLGIQKLCLYLGAKGRNIDDDIAYLVVNGLPTRIQQALDILRVVGNEAVHPGQLDMTDDVATALKLFTLLNLIADDRISEPKRIEELFGTLPETKRQAIEARDQRALGSPQEPQ
jgi:Domain of unknown function (DUF4145)